MKHSLQLRLSQHLTLTPQLQQSIRLLQLSTLELNQEIERLLQDNPLLEARGRRAGGSAPPNEASPQMAPGASSAGSRRPAPTTEDSSASTCEDGTSFSSSGGDDEDFSPVAAAARQPTLRHLNGQLALLHLSDRDRSWSPADRFARRRRLHDATARRDRCDAAAELEVEPEELSIALQHLQHLEPTGVGARSLAECLTLQLDALPPDTPYRVQAREIVREHLDALAARDFTALSVRSNATTAACVACKN
jgi:RNA polymerase sigma-54 factor